MELVKVKTEKVHKAMHECGLDGQYDSEDGSIKKITLYTKAGPFIITKSMYGESLQIMRPKIETVKSYLVHVKTKDRDIVFDVKHNKNTNDCEANVTSEFRDTFGSEAKIFVKEFDRPVNQTRADSIDTQPSSSDEIPF